MTMTNVLNVYDETRRDSLLDHFDDKIRKALDANDYLEVMRLAKCANAYRFSLHRGR